jgi:prolyl-tRNA editing enzyme YbaK/EbsC (Cys-tRNA(Pro) deacylase)
VAYEIVRLRRRIDDAAELPEVLGLPSEACLAVRLYDTGEGLVAALLPADRVAATSAVAEAAKADHARPLRPDRVSAVTEFHATLVPPVCLPEDVTVVADSAFGAQDVVYAPTGDGSTALKVRVSDLLALTGGRLAGLVEPGAVRHATQDWRVTRRS